MNYQLIRECWYRYIRMNDEERENFRRLLGLYEDYDIEDHNNSRHPFHLDIGGEG
jgi:hypothetical protein|tara:strand:+ start:252 stop:416 length:165 start_codon:yes stop_codon:yes gene_type:complete